MSTTETRPKVIIRYQYASPLPICGIVFAILGLFTIGALFIPQTAFCF